MTTILRFCHVLSRSNAREKATLRNLSMEPRATLCEIRVWKPCLPSINSKSFLLVWLPKLVLQCKATMSKYNSPPALSWCSDWTISAEGDASSQPKPWPVSIGGTAIHYLTDWHTVERPRKWLILASTQFWVWQSVKDTLNLMIIKSSLT